MDLQEHNNDVTKRLQRLMLAKHLEGLLYWALWFIWYSKFVAILERPKGLPLHSLTKRSPLLIG